MAIYVKKKDNFWKELQLYFNYLCARNYYKFKSIQIMSILIAVIVLMIASQWKVFQKAGQPGWACLVPFYNIIVLLQIIEKPIWWLLMFFIPFVNIYFCIITYIEFAKKFQKGIGFALGLLFLSPIFFPILAFGDATYEQENN